MAKGTVVSLLRRRNCWRPSASHCILELLSLDDLPPETAPGSDTLSVMLPYTPSIISFLMRIWRSSDRANISDDPLIIDNDEALEVEGVPTTAFCTTGRFLTAV